MGLRATGKLILASASPRRAELLRLLGLQLEIVPSGIDETFLNGETPNDHVLRLASEKALAISQRYPEAWVLAADTVVIIAGEVLGKPRTPSEAKEMLTRLSGRDHTVFTGFAISRRKGGILVRDVLRSSVLFKEISEQEIAWYVGSEEPYDKAGGYAVQGMSAFFIREIRGSYTNVMGLPLCEVVDALKCIGAITFGEDLRGISYTGTDCRNQE